MNYPLPEILTNKKPEYISVPEYTHALLVDVILEDYSNYNFLKEMMRPFYVSQICTIKYVS